MERRLGKIQRSILLNADHAIDNGITKGCLLSKCWAAVDRLREMGFLDQRFIDGRGPVYFINDEGRRALGQ